MSIINEALKKTQQSRTKVGDKHLQPAPIVSPASLIDTPVHKKTLSVVNKIDFFAVKRGGFIAMTLLLGMIAYIGYQHARNPALPIVQTAISTPKEKLAFAGIFISDKSKIAVINKQSYHLGDIVNGMKIVAISQDYVDLKRDDKIIQIRAGATYML